MWQLLLEPFCLHASVFSSFAHVCSTSSIISLLWEMITVFILTFTIQPILLTQVTAMKSFPCSLTSGITAYTFFSFWLTLLSDVDYPTTVTKRMARCPHYTMFACSMQWGQYSERGILTFDNPNVCCFSLPLQEEEIPELEIDIDELLELTDEGQRTRLQVRMCKLN